jgi:hypothetical protein
MSKKRPLSPMMVARQKRRAEQAVDGAQAMREYIKTNEATLDRLAQLRAERQAREAQTAGKGA